jgi:TRAP-type C4-dicarboxylate transport system permease small subunit
MLKQLDKFEEWFLALSLIIMLAITVVEVVSRYVFHLSLAFAEEITINLFVWSVMVGTATAAKHNHHLGFSLITDYLPAVWKRRATAAVALLCIGVFGLFGWYGVEMVESQIASGQTTPAMEIPEWIMGLAIPAGSLLCILRFGQAGWLEWKKGGEPN